MPNLLTKLSDLFLAPSRLLAYERERVQAERDRLALERERLEVTSEMLATSQRALAVEEEQRRLTLQVQHWLVSIHEVMSESAIENGIRIDNIWETVQRIAARLEIHRPSDTVQLKHDKAAGLVKEVGLLYRQAQILKERRAMGSIRPDEIISLEDIEKQIEILQVELQNGENET